MESHGAKAGRLNLSLLCERARNFVATNMNFQSSRPLRALSQYTGRAFHMQIYGAQAKLKTASLSVLKREPICRFPPPCARVRERAANTCILTEREMRDMNFSLSAGAHAAFRMPNNIYIRVVRRIYDSCLFREGETQPADPPSQDDMRPMHIKRVFFSRAEISRSSRSNADSERELQMYGVLPKTKGWFSYLGGVFRQR